MKSDTAAVSSATGNKICGSKAVSGGIVGGW